MHSITTLASSLLLAAGVIAQYGSGGSGSDSGYGVGSGSSGGDSGSSVSSASPPAPVATQPPAAGSSAAPAGTVHVHTVKVSNKKGDLTFTPNNFKAAKGSLVQFQFYPKKHSVVESTFDNPCVPINNVKPEVPGFFSGFVPVKAGDANLPTYTIMINDTKPIWFYCSQGDHCQDGMVGVINPPAKNQSRTIETFKELAKKAPENIIPSEGAAGGNSSSSGSSPSGSSVATAIPIPPSSTSGGSGLAGSNTTNPTSTVGAPSSSVSAFTGSGNTLASRRNLLAGIGLSGLAGLFVIFA